MLCYKPESKGSVVAARDGGRQSQSMAAVLRCPARRRGASV